MQDCWKKFMSCPCFKKSMYCPHCKKLEWRFNKTPQEFQILGCLKCRLGLYSQLKEIKPITYNEKNYRVSGRYN